MIELLSTIAMIIITIIKILFYAIKSILSLIFSLILLFIKKSKGATNNWYDKIISDKDGLGIEILDFKSSILETLNISNKTHPDIFKGLQLALIQFTEEIKNINNKGIEFIKFRSACINHYDLNITKLDSLDKNSVCTNLLKIFKEVKEYLETNKYKFPEIPQEFICPISGTIMVEAVYDNAHTQADGRTPAPVRYDKYAILQHKQQSNHNPITRKKMGELIHDETLQEKIYEFKKSYKPIIPVFSTTLKKPEQASTMLSSKDTCTSDTKVTGHEESTTTRLRAT